AARPRRRGHDRRDPPRSAGTGSDAIMVRMATRTPADPPVEPGSTNGSGALTRVDHAPSSWGLGDGAAIPWEYAPAPESRDVVTLKDRYGLFIGGKDVAASDGQVFATVNPATEEKLADV